MLHDVYGCLAGARHARGCHRAGGGGGVELDVFEGWAGVEIRGLAFAVKDGGGGHALVAGKSRAVERVEVVKLQGGILSVGGGGELFWRGGYSTRPRGVVRGRERRARVGASGVWNDFFGGEAVK